MNAWITALRHSITELRGPWLVGEDAWIRLTFNDGHADHQTTLLNLSQAVEAVAQRYVEAQRDGENGSAIEIRQEIVQLFAITTNARRVE